MFKAADLSRWRGRVDTDDAGDTRRFHQVVEDYAPGSAPGVALLGFCSDEGVRRNLGRVGAQEGPAAIRSALASMAWHAEARPLYDGGDICCEGERLEDAQGELELHVRSYITAGHLAIILGGGHEVAFGTGCGVLSSVPTPSRIGIINIDAHFDLRKAPTRNSGTSFFSLMERFSAVGQPFNYFCLGISESANTGALFSRAASLDVKWLLDEQIHANLDKARRELSLFVESCDHLYLSIDLDAMPAHEAPGVSAPAALGIPFSTVHAFVTQTAASGKLRAVDVAELNPSLDIDFRTARLAARLVHTIVHKRQL